MPSAAVIPAGCPFHTRCPRMLGEQCRTQEPPWRQTEDGHAYRCWIPSDDLARAQRRLWDESARGKDAMMCAAEGMAETR